MENSRENRLRKVFDYLVFSGIVKTQGEFADTIDVNKTNLSSAINGNEKYLSDSLFQKIHTTYPYINIQWLLTGDGNMLNDSEQNAIPIYGVQANIDTGQTSPKAPEPLPANAEIIPIVPSEVSGEMGIDIRKYVEKNADELDSIDPTKLLKNPDIAEQVAGTSMLPTFAPGDVVFIKFLPDKAKIIDGKTYYFDLRTLPTMIRKVKFEQGDRLRLVAKNPAFADIIINRSDILNIGRVIGMFRQTFGDQYDEIEEVRRRKDGQIDKLIDQNAKALESIGNLVDVIRNR